MTGNQSEPLAGASPTAVIVYDDSALTAKATAMLCRAVGKVDEAEQWKVKSWRLDLLRLSPLAEEALMDAVDAGLIVIAIHRDQFPPIRLAEWLERWAKGRKVDDAALAFCGGAGGDGLSTPVTPELSQFVQRHGVTSTCDALIQDMDGRTSLLREIQERQTELTPRLRRIPEIGRNGYQHWESKSKILESFVRFVQSRRRGSGNDGWPAAAGQVRIEHGSKPELRWRAHSGA